MYVCPPLPPLSQAVEFTQQGQLGKDSAAVVSWEPLHTKLLVKCFHQNQNEKVQSKHHQLEAGMKLSCQQIWREGHESP